MTDASRAADAASAELTALSQVLAEDAIFALAAGGADPAGTLDGLGKRRVEAHAAFLTKAPLARMGDDFEAWVVQLTRAIAPVAPPIWMPMMEVIREKVSLEVGARGLRSLFSSKPSDKDVQRVKRLGSLAVRALRAVFAADGPLDQEEATTIAAVIAAMGLPEADALALYNEAPAPIETLEVYGEMEPNVAKAVVRGAWFAAALDSIDPREEHVVRTLAKKLSVAPEEAEAGRVEAQVRVDSRKLAGAAAIDGIRYVLSDRAPGLGIKTAAQVGRLILPRRHRDEVLAHVGHGSPVTLARRYLQLVADDRAAVLGIAWAAALLEDPGVGRKALLRARWERFADDLGGDLGKPRLMVDEWVAEQLVVFARNIK